MSRQDFIARHQVGHVIEGGGGQAGSGAVTGSAFARLCGCCAHGGLLIAGHRLDLGIAVLDEKVRDDLGNERETAGPTPQ